MKSYALIQNGIVTEIIGPMVYDAEAFDWQEGSPSRIGTEIPITERYTPEFITWLVDITDMNPVPDLNWTYIDGVLAPPVPYVATPEEIRKRNVGTRNYFLDTATRAINPLQDAVDLGDATPEEEEMLLAWKRYRRDVNRVDLTQEFPTWPEPPEAFRAA